VRGGGEGGGEGDPGSLTSCNQAKIIGRGETLNAVPNLANEGKE